MCIMIKNGYIRQSLSIQLLYISAAFARLHLKHSSEGITLEGRGITCKSGSRGSRTANLPKCRVRVMSVVPSRYCAPESQRYLQRVQQ